jgi:hypothetical protein
MSFLVTAIVGGAVIGAGATLISGSKAASATTDATNAAIAEQNKIFQEQMTLEAPFVKLGTDALQKYKDLLGLGAQGPAGALQALQNTPGYQFIQQQGAGATKAQFAAMGLPLSGNTLQALDQYNTGLADTYYQQQLQDYQNAVQIGQGAASNTAANIGQAGTNISNLTAGQGANMAGIYANEAASIANISGNALNNYTFLNTLNSLMNNQNNLSPFVSPVGSTFPAGGGYTFNNPTPGG